MRHGTTRIVAAAFAAPLAALGIAFGGGGDGGVVLLRGAGDDEPLRPFGVNGFYVPVRVAAVNRIDTAAELEEHLRAGIIPPFRDLGASWGRVHPGAFGSFAWGNIDADEDGQGFDFSRADVYVRAAGEAGIELLPSLSPLKEDLWLRARTYVPSDLAAYRAYVQAVVERYDGDGRADMPGLARPIRFWQLDNEADLRNRHRGGGWVGFEGPAEYAEVLRATFEAARAADPTARVMVNLAGIGDDLGSYSLEYLRRLLAEGASPHFDVFSYHLYPATYGEEAYESHLASVRALVPDHPIWITEMAITSRATRGFAGDASEAAQARWLTQAYVFHVANGVARLFWLNLTDMAPGVPDSLGKHAGLSTFGPSPQPKPAYHTFRLLAQKLGDATSASQEGPGRHVFCFADGRRIYVLWSETPGTVDLSDAFGAVTVQVTRIVEDASRPIPATAEAPSRAVPVSESPILVEDQRP